MAGIRRRTRGFSKGSIQLRSYRRKITETEKDTEVKSLFCLVGKKKAKPPNISIHLVPDLQGASLFWWRRKSLISFFIIVLCRSWMYKKNENAADFVVFFHGYVGPNSRLLLFICYWEKFSPPIRRFDRPTLARRLRSSSLGFSPAVMGDESHGSGGRQRRSSRPLILMQRGEGFPFSDGDYIISTPPPRIPLRRSCVCGDGGLC